MDDSTYPDIVFPGEDPSLTALTYSPLNSFWADFDTYVTTYDVADLNEHFFNLSVSCQTGADLKGNLVTPFEATDLFIIDTQAPSLLDLSSNELIVNDNLIGSNTFDITLEFDEAMDESIMPTISFPSENPLAQSMSPGNAAWNADNSYTQSYNVTDVNELLTDIDLNLMNVRDQHGNPMLQVSFPDYFKIDMENPVVMSATSDIEQVGVENDKVTFLIDYSEDMDANAIPQIHFLENPELYAILTPDLTGSDWLSPSQYQMVMDVNGGAAFIDDVPVEIYIAEDASFNQQVPYLSTDLFSIERATEFSAVIYDDLSLFNLYPNPVSAGDELTVILGADKKVTVSIDLMDLSGRSIVAFEDNFEQNDRLIIPTQNLGSGIYLLRVDDGADSRTIRFEVIEN
jgi:hypothetical protein